MPASDDLFFELIKRIGEFYITDRAMKKAQSKIQTALALGSVDARARAEYLAVAQQYFAGFQSEARQHLRSVDERLEHASQVHFNLTAERGVAVRRIEATQGVLADLQSSLSDGPEVEGTKE